MLTTNKTNSIVRSILGILLAAVLLMTTCPITAHAADDNPSFSTLDAFPALGISSDTMNENLGTINTLYSGGTIGDNKGTISSSRGTVYANHGSIESLSAGKVGTNYGTINRIENTGSLDLNYMDGTVGFVGMGNEVGTNYGTIQVTAGLIGKNDGTIQENTGTVNHNYDTVSNNKGAVTMHDGEVDINYKNGVVLVENTGEADIYINHNEGSVKISSGYVEIKDNTGNIEITNAYVYVGENFGNITLGAGTVLECHANMSSGVITKTDKSAVITCDSDNGTIIDETAAWYKIVFVGDDGQAKITVCDKEENGVYYTQAGSIVTFTLPPEYECNAAMKLESGTVNTWGLNANPAEGDTEFTISCHKCTPGDYRMTTEKHWQICAGCGKMLTETEGTHTFGEFVSNDNSTCVKDGTETSVCTVCGYKRTRTAVDSHLTSNHHEHVVIDQRVEPTETTTGLTQGSHCVNCHKVLTAQEIIPALEHTHNYSYSTVVTDPTCTEKGYTTHTCACGDSYDDTYVDAKGHTLTEATCTRSAFCQRCREYVGNPLGHDFTGEYRDNGDDTHSRKCTRCDEYGATENHSYKDYVCVCGAEDLTGAKEDAKEAILAEQDDDTSEAVAKAVEDAISAIEAATTVDEVNAAMEDGIAAIRAAKAGNVPPTPVTYAILDGANSTWTKGSTSGLVARSDAPFAKFVGVKVDGKTIAATNYTAKEGSTIITLTPAYLETLEVGTHSLEIVSTDGSASTNFTVKANSRPADSTDPQTGDNSMIYLWALILVVSAAGLSATAIYSRKRKHN